MKKKIALTILAFLFISVLSVYGCGQQSAGHNNIEMNLQAQADKESESKPVSEFVYVYVSGAVKKEGVYKLRADARLFEAVEAAGGFNKKADRNSVNLADMVSDGQHIIVSRAGQEAGGSKAEGAAEPGSNQSKVNINTSDAAGLMTLTGIGEARAADIIRYREENGLFAKIEDIMLVTGIKDAAFSKIKDNITVN